MRTTIKDIARVTDLSVTTVSMILNGKNNRLSDRTRQLVLETARKLNYRPNQLAVGLVTKKTRTLGLIIPDISNLFFSELAKGVEDEAHKLGYHVIFCNTDDRQEKDLDYINVLADKGVDGILLAMSASVDQRKAQECLSLLNDRRIPFITIDRQFEGLESKTVRIDHTLGAYLAVSHLIAAGHTKIGCITGPAAVKNSKERFEGCRKAFSDAGISFDSSLVCEGDYHTASGISCGKELAAKGATAIFAFNDMMAYGVYQAARELGLKIPEDLSVVGFDDILFSELLEVPLTTVRQPVYQMGQDASRRIIFGFDGGQADDRPPIYQPELVIRSSVSRVRPD